MTKVTVEVSSDPSYWGEELTSHEAEDAAKKMAEMLEDILTEWYLDADISVDVVTDDESVVVMTESGRDLEAEYDISEYMEENWRYAVESVI